ncbi:MAG: ribonuclease III [Candidatus Omnitrophota bacterium]|nr:MAG: ribonuclease III [Candidatus Omnitrophota bacterium]
MLGKVQIKELEKRLGYRFKNKDLLIQALRHKSSVENSGGTNLDNERLEFLGDAVLDLIISDYLYRSYPHCREGDLTRFRAHLVNATRLLKKAKEINLERYIFFGKKEKEEISKSSFLSDAYEAIIGAIYLDRGIRAVSKFIYAHFSKEIESIEKGDYEKDYKSLLQEFALKTFKVVPIYELISTPEKEKKQFKVKVSIADKVYGQGCGSSIKKAQQNAAQVALRYLGHNAEEKFLQTLSKAEKKAKTSRKKNWLFYIISIIRH